MIIVKLIGGLGNQMFQYAAGRRSAYVNDTSLKLDLTGYKNQQGMTRREYMLDIFSLNQNFAIEKEINELKIVGKNRLARYYFKFISFFTLYYKRSYIIEKYFHFDPNILKISNNTYLEGYWISEKYFKDFKNIIKKDFTFKYPLDKKNEQMAEKIKNTNSVSIHVRRGDYVLDTKTNKTHGVCDLKYYLKAVALISKKVKNPQFFIFSDDIEWVKQNLLLKFPYIYVDYNTGKKDYEDMRLMSECKYNIIANSSFSWWGAWLNTNKDKIVIAPKNWVRNKNINITDLFPKSWLKI